MKRKQAVLKELLIRGELVDGTLVAEGGRRFPVHLQLLAAVSPFFRQSQQERGEGAPGAPIRLPGVPGDALGALVDYVYTGRLVLAADRVAPLLLAAEALGIPGVGRMCREFLRRSLDPANCIRMYRFARLHGYGELRDAAWGHLLRHFRDVFPVSREFLNLTGDELQGLLADDALAVHAEEYVFWAAMRWVEFDPLRRMDSVPALLRCVRMGLCDVRFYERNICCHPFVRHNESCQPLLYEATALHSDMRSEQPGRSFLDSSHPFLRPRVPPQVLLVSGGWSSGSATNFMESYDCRSDRWFICSAVDAMPRAYHGMVSMSGLVYVVGGFDGHQHFNCVRRFDPVTRVWEERAPMHGVRCYVSLAALGGRLYALGGHDGRRRTDTAERYDPDKNQWRMIANMKMVRSDASADALQGKVYIVGGFNGLQVLRSAETYDPQTNVWTLISDMLSPRSGVRLLAYNGILYAIGGFNGTARLSSVEKYDPRRERTEWRNATPMLGPRSNFAVGIVDGCLYVIGGFNGLSTVQSVECFDPRKNVWIAVAEMNMNRSALDACVLEDIPNLRDYSFLGNVRDGV